MNKKLNQNEKELLGSFERGEWKSIPNLSGAKKYFQEVAGETLRKDQKIAGSASVFRKKMEN